IPVGLVTALASIGGYLWNGLVEGASVLRADATVEPLRFESACLEQRTVFGFQVVGYALWISIVCGLFRIRGGHLARVGLECGLPVDTVLNLVLDDAGNAWVSSNRGVLRIPLAALDRAADGRGDGRLPVTQYAEIDGMPSSQGNGSSSPSA